MLTYSILIVVGLIQVLVIFVWVWQQFLINAIRRDGLIVGESPSDVIGEPITVIIPARNEASRIGETLGHLLQQDYPNMQAIVADDRSDDGTSGVVLAKAAGDGRVSVLRIDSLPDGWMGKSHAMWRAAQAASTDWLLFIDADCHLLPGGLTRAMEFARRHKADLLSLWPRDGSRGFWEQLLLPLCGAMIVIWYGRATRGERGKATFANGQFMLVRRDVYSSVDGHASVRDALIEDIPFASRLMDAGHRVISAIGTDVCRVRMYESLSDLVRGWQRIYIGVLRPWQIGLCMVSIVVGSLAPYVLIPICCVQFARGEGVGWAVLGGMAVIHLAALMATSVRFFSLAQCRLWFLWVYPLSCMGVLGILGSAWARSFGRARVEWRGTRYDVRHARIDKARGH